MVFALFMGIMEVFCAETQRSFPMTILFIISLVALATLLFCVEPASERGMQGSEPVSNEYFTGIHGMGSWRFRASMERLRLEIREALLPMHVRLHKNSSVYIQGTKS